MKKRLLMGVIALFTIGATMAQSGSFNSIKVNGYQITGVSNDTTAGNQNASKLLTEAAAKKLVVGRVASVVSAIPNVSTKLNKSDSTIYQSKFAADTAKARMNAGLLDPTTVNISSVEVSGFGTRYNTALGKFISKYTFVDGGNTIFGKVYNGNQTFSGSFNTLIGESSWQNFSGISNTYVGNNNGGSNASSKSYNTLIGSNAGRQVYSDRNTVVGAYAANSLFSGEENSFFGQSSANNTGVGSYNCVYGNKALFNNYSGSNNVAFGNETLMSSSAYDFNNYNTTGNIAIGYRSGYNVNQYRGDYNILIGYNVQMPSSQSNFMSIGNMIYGTGINGTGASLSTGSIGIANNAPSALLSLGTAGTRQGNISLAGSTSGTITVQPPATITNYTLTLPSSAGSANGVLVTNGSGTTSFTNDIIQNTVTSGQFKLSALNTAPSSATATGVTGEIRITNGYLYVCVATNSWQRVALTSW